MKLEEIRSMKSKELHEELEHLRRHLFDLRSQAVTEKLEDPNQITKARKDIARLLTVLKQRGEENVEQTQAHLTAEATRNR
jgi:large subunit ribosomal protein L29